MADRGGREPILYEALEVESTTSEPPWPLGSTQMCPIARGYAAPLRSPESQVDVARVLIDAGASLESRNVHGATPLMDAH